MKKTLFIILISLAISCDDIIEVEDISGRAVTVLAPANNTVLTNTSVNFSWDTVEDAESYRIQIATPTFDAAQQIVVDSIISVTNFTMTLSEINYEWRVRAENSGYATAYTTQSFSINEVPVDISNGLIDLLAPADATIFTETDTINFSWSAVTDADNYVIQIARPDFANSIEIIEDITQTETSFSVSDLAVSDYEWRVKATNTDYETAYTTQNFSVE